MEPLELWTHLTLDPCLGYAITTKQKTQGVYFHDIVTYSYWCFSWN